jgi:L-lactate dehydrogenase complex protein LldG
MTSARETILARLERARPPAVAAPGPMTPPPPAADQAGTLRTRVEEAGGRFEIVSRVGGPGGVPWPVDLADTAHIYSALPEVESRGVGLDASRNRDLDPLSLCVLRAEFAVVENGAVWHVPSRPRDRAAALLATHLVMVVDANELVPTLHEAYERIDLRGNHFGWFVCGPSKTADIEQALVLGAHGPKTMMLVLID